MLQCKLRCLKKTSMNLSIVILAAGQGKRMHSDKPKPLHTLAGKSLFAHVLNAAQHLNPQQMIVVYSKGLDAFQKEAGDQPIAWVEQAEQKGTGHAVMQALDVIPKRSSSACALRRCPFG